MKLTEKEETLPEFSSRIDQDFEKADIELIDVDMEKADVIEECSNQTSIELKKYE